MANQGGTHDQHVKAGQQSHKNMNDKARSASSSDSREQQSSGMRDGNHEQHVKAGQQSRKNH
ncbi:MULTISPECIES: hypothetical protein [Rhizobium]|uniref:Stress-induced protein n=1 Tax=Rhizobium paranaense TaxID=1650438 RepID=A0A7W8XTI7_9HYPH|nr:MULTISPECIES: hypothetical protein [Rhizobium]MBB5575335.1 hypothetical protein [Rhizobium paranaense]PST64268.1 hypothetical protein C9E91_01865 [Rhizobium sp. SEMIA4064]